MTGSVCHPRRGLNDPRRIGDHIDCVFLGIHPHAAPSSSPMPRTGLPNTAPVLVLDASLIVGVDLHEVPPRLISPPAILVDLLFLRFCAFGVAVSLYDVYPAGCCRLAVIQSVLD